MKHTHTDKKKEKLEGSAKPQYKMLPLWPMPYSNGLDLSISFGRLELGSSLTSPVAGQTVAPFKTWSKPADFKCVFLASTCLLISYKSTDFI